MITANVYTRIVFVAFGDSMGTAFTIEVDSRQYLVTARHVATDRAALTVSEGDAFVPVSTRDLAVPDNASIDIAVLALGTQLTRTLPLPATMDGLIWGQDVYFLGYPFGMRSLPQPYDRMRPLPFVKHAQFSGEFVDGDGSRVLVLDGLNVHGMSGGPIVFRPRNSNNFQIAGVVQSFFKRLSPVLNPNHADVLHPDGAETGDVVITNSGIVFGYNIDHAVQLARALGTGVQVDTDQS
ncbi:MAG: serine protease [Chloroflexi bacterium]|nr:serine protease [Chloroflexota bacterium]